jgi:hypothetical protein
MPIPEGARPSSLSHDVRVPEGARLMHPPVLWDEQGITQATYEFDGPARAVQESLVASLLQEGWSTDPRVGSGAGAMITARKGSRQLTIVMDENAGRTSLLIMEMEAPAP